MKLTYLIFPLLIITLYITIRKISYNKDKFLHVLLSVVVGILLLFSIRLPFNSFLYLFSATYYTPIISGLSSMVCLFIMRSLKVKRTGIYEIILTFIIVTIIAYTIQRFNFTAAALTSIFVSLSLLNCIIFNDEVTLMANVELEKNSANSLVPNVNCMNSGNNSRNPNNAWASSSNAGANRSAYPMQVESLILRWSEQAKQDCQRKMDTLLNEAKKSNDPRFCNSKICA